MDGPERGTLVSASFTFSLGWLEIGDMDMFLDFLFYVVAEVLEEPNVCCFVCEKCLNFGRLTF